MPYVITTRRPRAATAAKYAHTRTAVDSLDRARWWVAQQWHMINDGRDERARVNRAIGEAGGIIGPLPDGTVIEVQPADYQTLTDALPGDYVANARLSDPDVLAAFNAQQL